MRFNRCSALMGFILLLFFSTAQAGVVVGGTRVIFNGEKKEASISVDNPDNEPYLIQSWLDNQQSGLDKIAFIITPPLFRLDGHQENMLRIVRVGDDLPKDKESLYWMNIKSIPSTEHTGKSNTLQIAVKTRLKLIYRPAALLKQVPEDVTQRLTWQRVGKELKLTNPTPYYMNFHYVRIGGREMKEVTYIAPMSSEIFSLPVSGASSVSWKLINDYGGTGKEHQSGI
ncbi:molecular chaperone [Serratia marcescens]|uniref:fimbrial biogenesis chaperone n=1 Tax=Serratia marcescens TaxID=615 RepID=UPI002FD8F2AC